MSFKHKRDLSTAWEDHEGFYSGSGSSEPSTSVDDRPNVERRAGKWHRNSRYPQLEGTALLNDDSSRESSGTRVSSGGRLKASHHGNNYGYIKRPHQNHKHQQLQQLQQPLPAPGAARSQEVRVANGLKQDSLMPNPLATSAGKHDGRTNSYPPIITIDGRVDTDLDHLIDEESEEDQRYDGPVEEMPSRYPKPHVFSVIHGSLDDDVDSYANDDGTLEHTLVDAPKNFHPKDLKDVASRDRSGSLTRPGQIKSRRSGACSEGRASQLLNYTDRSHNKMHPENTEAERRDLYSIGDKNYHLEDPKRAQHHLSRTGLELAQAGSRRQVFSDGGVPSNQLLEVNSATMLTDSLTIIKHREIPEAVRDSRKSLNSKPSNGQQEDDCEHKLFKQFPEDGSKNSVERKKSGANHNEAIGAKRYHRKLPSPDKSASEQTQNSGKNGVIALRRPASCTSKYPERYNKRSSPNRSSTKFCRNKEGNSESGEEEEYTFITCRESMHKSSATLATNDSRIRSHGVKDSSEGRREQAFGVRKLENSRPNRCKKLNSDVSSVKGFESFESDIDISQDIETSEKYCSDPLETKRKFSASDAEMSKSDTKASADCMSKRCLRQRRPPLHSNKRNKRQSKALPLTTDSVETYEESDCSPQKGQTNSPNKEENNTEDQVQFYDTEENASPDKSITKKETGLSQHPGQKYFAISRVNSEKGYRSKFLIQEMTSQGGKDIPKECTVRHQDKKSRENHNEKSPRASHIGDTIWHGTDQFLPAYSNRHKYDRSARFEDNREICNMRRKSKSPLKQPIEHEMLDRREAKRNWSPTRPDWHGQLSPKERQREASMLQKRAQDFAAYMKTPYHNMVDGEVSLTSPQTWNNMDQFWNQRVSESLTRERCKQEGHCPLPTKESRRGRHRSPRASWSLDSDHSPVAYRHTSRMMPYHKRILSKNQREALARAEGTPVDSIYPLLQHKRVSETKTVIGDIPIKAVATKVTDDDLKNSLKKAMKIARKSLTAAAKVSKALNFVMSSSPLSFGSCSDSGSCNDPLSPASCYPDVTSIKQVLTLTEPQKSPFSSSRNTDQSHVLMRRSRSRRHMSSYSHSTVSPEMLASYEEPNFIGRSQLRSAHRETKRSRSVVSDRAGVLSMVPNYSGYPEKMDGCETPGPLVSIYIGGSNSHQEPLQLARIMPSNAHQDYPDACGAREGDSCTSKASLRSHKEKNCESLTNELCLLGQQQGFSELKKHSNPSFYPQRTEIICGNVTMAQRNQPPASKLSDSSNSQEFQSTKESLEDVKETINWDTKELTKKQQDIPTHEDGSVRTASKLQSLESLGVRRHDKPYPGHPQIAIPSPKDIMTSFTNLTEKFHTTFEFMRPLDSRSPMMSAAIDFLKKHHRSFSPICRRSGLTSPPPSKKIILQCGQLSSPNSVYTSASAGDQVTKKVAEANSCMLSASSCVDPSGYLKIGSPVDPPSQTRTHNANDNKSPHQRSSHLAQGDTCCKSEDASQSKRLKPPFYTESQNLTISQNNCTLHKSSRKKVDRKFSKIKTEKPSEHQPISMDDSSIQKSCTLTKAEVSDYKNHKSRKRKHGHQLKNQKHPIIDDTVSSCQRELPQNNMNNNSTHGDMIEYGRLLGDVGEEDFGFLDSSLPERDLFREEEAEGGAVGGSAPPNCNQNKPVYDSFKGSPEGEARLEDETRDPRAPKAEGPAPNGILVSKNKDRHHRHSSSHKVRKSLYHAIQLADESLSAAAKVSQLLNQVVDVYQHRHPFDTEDIARLAVQNRAMISEILACTKDLSRPRTASDTKALTYDQKHRKAKHNSRELKIPEDLLDSRESRRHKHKHDVSEPKQSRKISRSPSCRSYRENDRSLSHASHDRSPERRRALSSEGRSFHDSRSKTPPQGKRTKYVGDAYYGDKESMRNRKRSVEFCPIPDGSGECYAMRRKISPDKNKHEKLKCLARRHSGELGYGEQNHWDLHNGSLKKQRNNQSREKYQSPEHQAKRKSDGSRKQQVEQNFYSDVDGDEMYKESQKSSKHPHKHHKILRETNSPQQTRHSPAHERDDNSQRKQGRRETKEIHHTTPSENKKKSRDADRQSHKKGLERECHDNHEKEKTAASSPTKEKINSETIKRVGSSVDSPEHFKTKPRQRNRSHNRSSEKSQLDNGQYIYGEALSREKKQFKPLNTTNASKKTVPSLKDISDAQGSHNAGKRDMDSPHREIEKSERSQCAYPSSEKKLKRRKRSKSSSSKRLEHRMPDSTSLDGPSTFPKVDLPASPVSVPEAEDGENCSFNKSVDVKSYSDNHLCVPVKHKYPATSENHKTLLITRKPQTSEQSCQEREHMIKVDCWKNSPTCVEEKLCQISGISHKPMCKETESLSSKDNLGSKEKMILNDFNKEIESSDSSACYRNRSIDDVVSHKLTYRNRKKTAALSKDICSNQALLLPNHIQAEDCKTSEWKPSEDCIACFSVEESTSDSVTPSSKLPNKVDTTRLHGLTPEHWQLIERRTNNTADNGVHETLTITPEVDGGRLHHVYCRKIEGTAYDNEKLRKFMDSYTAYTNTTTTQDNPRQSDFHCFNTSYKNDRAKSNTILSAESTTTSNYDFSTPETARDQLSGGRSSSLSSRCGDACHQERDWTPKRESSRQERQDHVGGRGERIFLFAESPGKIEENGERRARQTTTKLQKRLTPESAGNFSSSSGFSGEKTCRLTRYDVVQKHPEYSSEDSMISYTVSNSSTYAEGDEGHALSCSEKSSPKALQYKRTHTKQPSRTSYSNALQDGYHRTPHTDRPISPAQASSYPSHNQILRQEFSCLNQPKIPRDFSSEQLVQAGDFEADEMQIPPLFSSVVINEEEREVQLVSPELVKDCLELDCKDCVQHEGIIGPTGVPGRGPYSLYRPLDNFQQGNFSPIIEESDTSGGAVFRKPERVGSSLYASNGRPSIRRSDTTNNCSAGAPTSWSVLPENARGTFGRSISSSIHPVEDDILHFNSNNNASRSLGADGSDAEQLYLDTLNMLSRRRQCRSQTVVPEPFCRSKRRQLPPLKPAPPMKVQRPFPFLNEYEKFRMLEENKILCKRLMAVRKKGCTFDTGRKQTNANILPSGQTSKTTARMSEMEGISRENENLLRRIINKESFYKRTDQLREYDKKLPKLLSFSKYPEALIKNRNLKFQ